MNNIYKTLWEFIDVREPDLCWEWKRSKTKAGYGHFRKDKQIFYTHRIVYQEVYGIIPKGMQVCHKCDNPSCCNPAHLFLGTSKDNINDAINKGRRSYSPKRHVPKRWHKLSLATVNRIRKMYKDYDITQKELSALFGRSQGNISKILSSKTTISIV